MALIKSALELALEKTKDVKSDKKSLEKKHLMKEGKKLASKLFNNHDPAIIAEDLIKIELKKYDKDKKKIVLQGLNSAILSNIQIPSDYNNVIKNRLQVIESVLLFSTDNKKRMALILQQFKDFVETYFQNLEGLKTQLTAQIAPLVQQKEAEVLEKTGNEVHLTAEQLPEYAQALKQNIDHINKQYQEALDKVKEEISAII